jgi:hypothetical protein
MLPSWLIDLFAALMLAIATYFAGRLVAARAWHRQVHREVNVAELVMGVAMAGMFLAVLNPLPNGLWEGIFGAFALWFLIRTIRFVRRHGLVGGDIVVRYHRLHYPLHVIMSGAMLYMFLAASPISSSGQMAMVAPTGTKADFVWLALLFIVLLLGFAVWQLDGINRLHPVKRAVATSDLDLVTTPLGPERAPSATPEVTEWSETDPLERWQIQRWLAPRLESGSLIVMSIAMAVLLVLML